MTQYVLISVTRGVIMTPYLLVSETRCHNDTISSYFRRYGVIMTPLVTEIRTYCVIMTPLVRQLLKQEDMLSF
jgi:cytosine/uracil/thiamine/allantoin permease